MNFHPRRREEPEINLTSLIDVVLTVLLFFIVTTTFRKESDMRLDLPAAAAQPLAAAAQPRLQVTVDAQGRYSIDEQPLADNSPETLWNALAQRAGGRRDQTFVIRAAAQTPYQAVVTVMDVAGRLGFRHLALPTAPRSGATVPTQGGPP